MINSTQSLYHDSSYAYLIYTRTMVAWRPRTMVDSCIHDERKRICGLTGNVDNVGEH